MVGPHHDESVPPYVHSYDWDPEDIDGEPTNTTSFEYPQRSRTLLYTPSHNQEDEHLSTLNGSRWRDFMTSSGSQPTKTLTAEEAERSRKIWAEYEAKNISSEGKASSPTPIIPRWNLRKRMEGKHVVPFIMKNPFVPLMFRGFILCTSIIALGLGGASYTKLKHSGCRLDGSTYLAIIVDALAIPYTMYIAWDEFVSAPIGLRKASSKLKLLLLDLFFIVLEAVNLTLACEVLESDDLSCSPKGKCVLGEVFCNVQKVLVATLLVALIAWLSTFVVSLSRLMTKIR